MTLFIVGWIVCGLLTWGGWFAYDQRGWPAIAVENRRASRFVAICFGLLGPMGLAISILLTFIVERNWLFRHGLKF